MRRSIICAIASVMPLLAIGTSDAKAGGWYDRGYYGYPYYPAPVYGPYRPYYYGYDVYPAYAYRPYYRPYYYRPYPVIGIGWGWGGWRGYGWRHRW